MSPPVGYAGDSILPRTRFPTRRVIQVAAFQQYSALLRNAIVRQPVPGIVMIVVAVAAAVVDFTLMSYSFMTFLISFYFT
ncbi:TPA: hypothetical protein OT171_004923 [Citrobacter sedlakii]|nr:hypothetical protein [Citrobacter sedlakii]